MPALTPIFLQTDQPKTEHERFDVQAYLASERTKDLLRFSTAGSVDDGKSTLIGRLLYDTQNVYDDQVRAIAGKGSAGEGQLDLALLTDGLRAEREQGITIDVAYRYFSTAHRKFIIADTPGHEQYTRNMATGASTADVAIVLVDARKGVLLQSRRHAYIAALLGVPHIIVAINKMDLVSYAEHVYSQIRSDFQSFFDSLEEHTGSRLHYIPVSALAGDNVARPSEHMPWYTGPTLLELLERVPPMENVPEAPFRFVVQRVLRPDQNFRGFAGQIAAGTVRPGDAVLLLPSRRHTRVRSIVTYDGDLAQAAAPLSVCLTLEDEVDLSRGDMLASPRLPAHLTSSFTASLVWMDAQPLALGRRYLLKHTSRTVAANVRTILYSVNVADLTRGAAATLATNGIALVVIDAQQALALDLYSTNRHTGSFVLIDAETNATVAAGMVRSLVAEPGVETSPHRGPVTAPERAARWGHTGARLALRGPAAFGPAVERALFALGAVVFACEAGDAALQNAIVAGGGIALTLTLTLASEDRYQARVDNQATDIITNSATEPNAEAAESVLALLRHAGVLRTGTVPPPNGEDR